MTADRDFQGGFFLKVEQQQDVLTVIFLGLRCCGRMTHMSYTSFVS